MNAIMEWFASAFSSPLRSAAQILGFFPMFMGFFIFTQKERKKVIMLKMFTDLLSVSHYLMLGEFSGGVTVGICVVRDYVFGQRGRKKWVESIVTPIVFAVALSIGTLLSWQGAKSLLPMIGSIFAIFGFWSEEVSRIRKFNFVGMFLWLIYGFIVASVSTIIGNTVSLVSIILAEISAYRMRKKA